MGRTIQYFAKNYQLEHIYLCCKKSNRPTKMSVTESHFREHLKICLLTAFLTLPVREEVVLIMNSTAFLT